MNKRKTAFTLVEMLVVIAIIGILMALLLPVVGKVRANANASKCNSNLKNIAVGFFAYADDHNGFFPAVAATNTTIDGVFFEYPKPPDYIGPYLQKRSSGNKKETIWHCPSDDRDAVDISYGYNVSEVSRILGDSGWNKKKYSMDMIPKPSGTIWQGDSGGDDSHGWSMHWDGGDPKVLGVQFRHLGRNRDQSVAYVDEQEILDQDGSANFLFYDGHVEGLRYTELTNSMWKNN